MQSRTGRRENGAERGSKRLLEMRGQNGLNRIKQFGKTPHHPARGQHRSVPWKSPRAFWFRQPGARVDRYRRQGGSVPQRISSPRQGMFPSTRSLIAILFRHSPGRLPRPLSTRTCSGAPIGFPTCTGFPSQRGDIGDAALWRTKRSVSVLRCAGAYGSTRSFGDV